MTVDRISRLEQLARQTGNPTFAWEAVSCCESPSDLPPWVWRYLCQSAKRLLAVDADPRTLSGAILDALMLSGDVGGAMIWMGLPD
jgi:hypothetical protein